ncbi:Glycosyltransferase involved in cell wall bisynthesis [Ferrithrix thermotolerans DSM 19514]|uniref:Glycosyltransferase involved in cell wall bisynthesis n=1 Tax=Ferrithrix thermotolerans DSM 19514 TaxID=1121881 RepID=A0A1M4VBT1_9ACTN|nr:glycosyltransferase family A protein [Ferrithrix thermotolerans]SHE66330.1 Glycosyltransferase involved in cell wall bisynthesis [Ferrithrix thermotolerans DSM 19514]
MLSGEQITVVITAYNSQETISRAIDSVLDQTVQPKEIIVVDDGSTDATAQILLSFDDKIRVISQRNQGPSAARNTGIKAAKTTWIALLDGDDLWHREKLQRQIKALECTDELDLIASSWSRTPPDPGPFTCTLTRLSYISLLIMNRFQTSTVLVKKASIEEHGGFNPSLDTVEDWAMWLKLSSSKRLAILEQPLVLYRDNPTGVSKDLNEFFKKTVLLIDQEASQGLLNTDLFNKVAAWHYLRIAANMGLTKQYQSALQVVLALYRSKYRANAFPAARDYLAPFLISRLRRRKLVGSSQ